MVLLIDSKNIKALEIQIEEKFKDGICSKYWRHGYLSALRDIEKTAETLSRDIEKTAESFSFSDKELADIIRRYEQDISARENEIKHTSRTDGCHYEKATANWLKGIVKKIKRIGGK